MPEDGGYSPALLDTLSRSGIGIYDRIRIRTGSLVIEGTLMPRPGYGDPDCLVVKLDSGYNIGIKFGEEVGMELVREGRASGIKPLGRGVRRESLPTVSLIGTGGTIASRVDYSTGAVYPIFTPEELYEAFPELLEMAHLRTESLFSILSEDMRPDYWTRIAEATYRHFTEGAVGIIIAHGTDTMSYTSAALSFALGKLPGPVCLVGSQRSSDRPSSDAFMNLVSATAVAINAPFGEVVVVMHGETSDTCCLVHRGTKVRKCHTSRRDAFRSINQMALAKVEGGKIIMLTGDYKPRSPLSELELKARFNDKVFLLKSYPGIDPEVADFLVDKGYHGIVLEGTGLGHVPEKLLPPIKRAIDGGIAVVMTSQCLWGRINMNVYSRGVELLKLGVIPGEDMLPEVALVKLMWVLAQTRDLEEVRKLMLTNIAGEISNRTTFDLYPSVMY